MQVQQTQKMHFLHFIPDTQYKKIRLPLLFRQAGTIAFQVQYIVTNQYITNKVDILQKYMNNTSVP